MFSFVALESLGVPLPGETALIVAGAYAGVTHHLSPWFIFAVAALGAIIGDNIGYWVGRTTGYRLLRRYGHHIRLDESKLQVARYLFARHGGKLVFFARFVSVLRTYAALLAGALHMRPGRFVVFNMTGAISWAALYTSVSYVAGRTLEKLSGPLDLALGLVAVTGMVGGWLFARRRFAELVPRAQSAFP